MPCRRQTTISDMAFDDDSGDDFHDVGEDMVNDAEEEKKVVRKTEKGRAVIHSAVGDTYEQLHEVSVPHPAIR